MAEEEWIWGNHRGGGGAPVLSETGEKVSNLRDVARGRVQVDQLSPSARRLRGHHSYDDHERYDKNSDSSSYQSRNQSYSDTNKHMYDDVQSGSPRPHANVQPAAFVSPSHRGARKNMFVSDAERMERVRKAKEYQESLREQVEEKRRQKDVQEREKRDLKNQEYEEYMSQHYQGKIPEHGHRQERSHAPGGGRRRVQNSPPYQDDRGYNNTTYDSHEPHASPHHGRREQNTPPHRSRRDQRTPPRHSHREQCDRRDRSTPPRSNFRDKPYDDGRDQSTHSKVGRREQLTPPRFTDRHNGAGSSMNPDNRGVISPITNDKKSPESRRADRGRRPAGGEEGWVSKVEYEELSALCKGLMRQQQELEERLEQQNHIIKDLQSGSEEVKGTRVPTKRAPRARNDLNGGGLRQGGRGQAVPVEKKISARQSAALAAAEKKKKPKVSLGFGSRVETTKEKERRERIAANAMRSQSHSGSRRVKQNAVPEFAKHEQRPTSMKASGDGRGGFKQLQARIKTEEKGPKVVTYDDDVAGGGMKQISPNKMRSSQGGELRGASDLLYIQGSDVDRISEDQLDKLLGKARGAR